MGDETVDQSVIFQTFTEWALPETDLALAVLSMLTYKKELTRARVLCLVK